MKNMLDRLVNSKIDILIKMLDYWYLSFDVGDMAIYNPTYCYDPKGNKGNIDDMINVITGQRIKRVIFKDGEDVSLVLKSRSRLVISLKDDDYTGPEALCIKYNTGEYVVIQ